MSAANYWPAVLLSYADSSTNTHPAITDKSLNIIMRIIKKTLGPENVWFLTLHNMHQDREEGIRTFTARLGGQAEVCVQVCGKVRMQPCNRCCVHGPNDERFVA